METAFSTNSPDLPYSELTYFTDATQKGDANAITNMNRIAKGYADTAAAITKIPVPAEAAAADLSLVNVMAHLSATITDLAAVQADPIRGMLGLQEYETDSDSLVTALSAVGDVFTAGGVSIAQGGNGYFFFNLATTAKAAVQNP